MGDSGASTFHRSLQSLQAEFRVEAVIELPAGHLPGVHVYDRNQVEKVLLERDVGDVHGPHLIHSINLIEIRQERYTFGWYAWSRCTRFLVDSA